MSFSFNPTTGWVHPHPQLWRCQRGAGCHPHKSCQQQLGYQHLEDLWFLHGTNFPDGAGVGEAVKDPNVRGSNPNYPGTPDKEMCEDQYDANLYLCNEECSQGQRLQHLHTGKLRALKGHPQREIKQRVHIRV